MFYIESDAYAFGHSRVGKGPSSFKVIPEHIRVAGRLIPVWRVKFVFG